MGQKVLDRDILDEGLIRRCAVIGPEHAASAEHLVGKRQAALLDQRKHRDRGQHLADAGDAKQVRGYDFLSPRLVGETEARLIKDLSAIRDRDRKPGYALILQECRCDVCHRCALGGYNRGGRLRAGQTRPHATSQSQGSDAANQISSRCGHPTHLAHIRFDIFLPRSRSPELALRRARRWRSAIEPARTTTLQLSKHWCAQRACTHYHGDHDCTDHGIRRFVYRPATHFVRRRPNEDGSTPYKIVSRRHKQGALSEAKPTGRWREIDGWARRFRVFAVLLVNA
jgi:hypothetical protein